MQYRRLSLTYHLFNRQIDDFRRNFLVWPSSRLREHLEHCRSLKVIEIIESLSNIWANDDNAMIRQEYHLLVPKLRCNPMSLIIIKRKTVVFVIISDLVVEPDRDPVPQQDRL